MSLGGEWMQVDENGGGDTFHAFMDVSEGLIRHETLRS